MTGEPRRGPYAISRAGQAGRSVKEDHENASHIPIKQVPTLRR
jgi:hypothetical protein